MPRRPGACHKVILKFGIVPFAAFLNEFLKSIPGYVTSVPATDNGERPALYEITQAILGKAVFPRRLPYCHNRFCICFHD
jgi:hypothetical protein